MYPWDTRPPAPRNGADPATHDSATHDSATKDSATKDPVTQDGVTQDLATQAVQVALDRRDNGGDADQ
jgi:hypothetical protein